MLFVKDYALYVHLTYKNDDLLGKVQSTNDNKMSKVHARSHEITNKPLRVHSTKIGTQWVLVSAAIGIVLKIVFA